MDSSYVELLKNIQNIVKLEALSVKMKDVMQTRNGDVLIEVRNKIEVEVKLSSAIREAVGNGLNAHRLDPRTLGILQS